MDWSGTAVTCDGTFSLSSHHSSKGILDCLALGNVFQIYPIPTVFFFFGLSDRGGRPRLRYKSYDNDDNDTQWGREGGGG